MARVLTIIICLWAGSYFLYEVNLSLPEKSVLREFNGEITFVGECVGIKYAGTQQQIEMRNNNADLRFKIRCVNGGEKLEKWHVGNNSIAIYGIGYEFFIIPYIDVYGLEVNGEEIILYDDRLKFHNGASLFAMFLAFLFLAVGIFQIYRYFENRGG